MFLPLHPQSWNVLALDGSNWQRIDLFDFQRDIEVCRPKFTLVTLLKLPLSALA